MNVGYIPRLTEEYNPDEYMRVWGKNEFEVELCAVCRET
jgi:hypothetical protein